MLRPQLLAPSSHGTTNFVLPQLSNHFFHGSCSTSSSLLRLGRPSAAKTGQHKAKPRGIKTVRCVSSKEVQTTTTSKDPSVVSVKGIITVQQSVGNFLSNIGIDRGLDDIKDLFGMSILVEIVSAELDPKTGLEKPTITDYAHKVENDKGVISYQADFTIPRDFGEIGAILVENEHHKEMFVKAIVLTGYGDNPVTFICNSWVHSKYDNPEKRVFFNTKSYLPSQTPRGLKELRKKELTLLRGDGKGERKPWERVYDYDVYNDLGNPDDDNLARPVLGGKEHPYPRRCRTGRPRTEKDPNSESRDGYWYLPRDEEFSELKQTTFSIKTLRSLLHAVVPIIETSLVDPDLRFPYFTAIDKLFNEGVNVPAKEAKLFNGILPRLLKVIGNMNDGILLFETPEMIDRDKFSWFRDEEFSRQTLAGLNPFSIELVREFPFVSKLDPEIYGPPESALTKELIEREIKSVMTVEEALKQKKLFIIDYHDLFLPYVQRVRELDGTTLYGSRTLFFLQPDDTLQLVAIELTRPASPTQPQWKGVFTSCWDATSAWLWKLAKAHVLAHDSGYHQLVSHWLRTHACVEPYIIAANRQLSEMHPIFRLLRPHFRYTMDINNLARQSLINAGGIIETCFSPLKYSIEISSAAYDKLWRFDMEALPADLVKRGMAVEDPTAEHGLRLTIKDYPYACDGLLLWSAIKDWVSDYVCHYYPDDAAVASDDELQSFWLEVRTKGHGDKKDEPWWPVLDSRESLVHVLTTIIWVGSGHHAAANFGQYHFAGYFPNRPTITRRNMPCEEGNEQEFDRFFEKPERALLETFPAQAQATKVMAILDVLSNHSVDEEYIGALDEEDWSGAHNAVIRAAYERFYGRLKEIEGIIDERNTNQKLKNRCGAGVVPYELLKPFSEPGVTGKGVPNSISI